MNCEDSASHTELFTIISSSTLDFDAFCQHLSFFRSDCYAGRLNAKKWVNDSIFEIVHTFFNLPDLVLASDSQDFSNIAWVRRICGFNSEFAHVSFYHLLLAYLIQGSCFMQ